jgi:spermidine synthase
MTGPRSLCLEEINLYQVGMTVALTGSMVASFEPEQRLGNEPLLDAAADVPSTQQVQVERPAQRLDEQRLLPVLFFASGFAALLYQIVWQRTLFSIYGINIESVTVIVTAFMLGLGFGSLGGGAISKRARLPVVLLFAGVEAAIGLYGLASLSLFRLVGAATLDEAPGVIALVTLLMVLVPTTLMGATLPLLVAHFTRRSQNVGDSVGELYYVNTLGAAFASILSVLFVLGHLGQAHTVQAAAALNLASALAAFWLYRRGRASK